MDRCVDDGLNYCKIMGYVTIEKISINSNSNKNIIMLKNQFNSNSNNGKCNNNFQIDVKN